MLFLHKIAIDFSKVPEAKQVLNAALGTLEEYRLDATSMRSAQDAGDDVEKTRLAPKLVAAAKKIATDFHKVLEMAAPKAFSTPLGVSTVGGVLAKMDPDLFRNVQAVVGISTVPDAELSQELLTFIKGERPRSGATEAAFIALQNPETLQSMVLALATTPDGDTIVESSKNFGPSSEKATKEMTKFKKYDAQAIQRVNNSSKSKGIMMKAANAKEQKVMEDHSEFIRGVMNAGSYFTYDKTPVVEAIVKNPNEEREPALNPNEITGKDIIGLATYAASIVDPRVATGPAGISGAIMDAAIRAVAEKDEGKYSGRVSSPTMDILVKQVEKLVGTKVPAKPENQNSKYMDLAEKGQKADPAEGIPTAETGTYVEPRIEEDPTIVRPAPRMTAKEASDATVAEEAEKEAAIKEKAEKPAPPPQSVLQHVIETAKAAPRAQSKGQEANMLKGIKRALPPSLRGKLAADIDALSEKLDEKGLPHLAEQLDVVANTIEQD